MATTEMTERINGFDNPNWMDSALKRCTRFNCWYATGSCYICCNKDICTQLRREAQEQEKAQLEEILRQCEVPTITIDTENSVYVEDYQRMYITSSPRDNDQRLNMYMGSGSRTSEWLRYLYSSRHRDSND